MICVIIMGGIAFSLFSNSNNNNNSKTLMIIWNNVFRSQFVFIIWCKFRLTRFCLSSSPSYVFNHQFKFIFCLFPFHPLTIISWSTQIKVPQTPFLPLKCLYVKNHFFKRFATMLGTTTPSQCHHRASSSLLMGSFGRWLSLKHWLHHQCQKNE